MKFSDIGQKDWPGLQPYLDTCVLPLTGLAGDESPWQAAAELEKLRDLLDLIEMPYRGRVVTYPAVQYEVPGETESFLRGLCERLKSGGFRYVILVTASDRCDGDNAGADLVMSPRTLSGWKERLQALWHGEPAPDNRV